MLVRPVPLTDEVKWVLGRSMETASWTWEEIEAWIAARVARVWQIGDQAYAITAANIDDEIDIIVGGGSGALRAARPFLKHMRTLPEHKGRALRLEGRRGWKRFCENWDCEEVGGGDVILTKRC